MPNDKLGLGWLLYRRRDAEMYMYLCFLLQFGFFMIRKRTPPRSIRQFQQRLHMNRFRVAHPFPETFRPIIQRLPQRFQRFDNVRSVLSREFVKLLVRNGELQRFLRDKK